jgi:P-type Ca2+ transporter type 2C
MTGAELNDISEEELKEKILSKEVIFAGINPEHKLRVVSSFKSLNKIVVITGDGVNDAPALKI